MRLYGIFLLTACLMTLTQVAKANKDTLVLGYTSAPPFLIVEDAVPQGVNIWLWEHIAADLQLNYKLEERSFPDILQGLESGSIDISINPLTMTAARSMRFAFTSPFFVSNTTIAMKAKGEWSNIRKVIAAAFSLEFLSALVFLLVIVGVFGLLTWQFEKKENPNDFRQGIKGMWDGFWWSAVTMTTVGYGDKKIRSFGGKVVALIWMFAALIFISGLTASIASTILNNEDFGQVQQVDELKDRRVGTQANSNMLTFLRRRFFKEVIPFQSIEEGLDALENEEIEAFIYDEPILQYRLTERNTDKIEILPISFDLQLFAFGVAKNKEELRSQISERILHYTNSLEWKVLLHEYDLRI